MKILYDHQIFTLQKFGGISRYFNELMKMQNQSIVFDTIDPALFTVANKPSSNDLFSRAQRFVGRKLGNTKQIGADLPIQAQMKLELGDYDILHPTYYDPYFLLRTKKPFVLTVYDMIHEIYKEYFPMNDSISSNKRLLCEKADSIIAISHKTKNDLMQIFNVPEEKVFVTHLASDFHKYQPTEPTIEFELKRYILFIGNRGHYKNFYFMIISLREILLSDSNVQILCTGTEFNDLEINFFNEIGISQQILHIYLENDTELAWIYRHAAVFIFPSLYEGFGLPILEAFTSDCPVVSSLGGSLPEVAGDAALYFDPKSITQLQDAVSSVLYSGEVRKELIDKGKNRYAEFSWERCRNETIEVYKKTTLNYSKR